MNDLSQLFGADFFTNQYEPLQDYQPVPPGDYLCTIRTAELKQTKAGTGMYVELQLVVVSPDEYRNRVVWDRINVANPSQQAVEIGKRKLSACAISAGLQVVQGTAQLLNQIVLAAVKVKEERNEVRTYKSRDGVTPQVQSQPTPVPQAPPQQATPQQAAPWQSPPQAPQQPMAPQQPQVPQGVSPAIQAALAQFAQQQQLQQQQPTQSLGPVSPYPAQGVPPWANNS